MVDFYAVGIFLLRLAMVAGAAVSWWPSNPDTYLPPHVCGAAPAPVGPQNIVDDWQVDPRRPVGYYAYPPIASRHHEEGTAVVTICILPDGWVGDARLRRSSGSAQLDAETLISSGEWHFVRAPGGINGVPEWADVAIRFAMPDVSQAALPKLLPPAPPLDRKAPGENAPPVVDPAFPHRSAYPRLAWRHNEEGVVVLAYDIEQDGWPGRVEIVRSSGSQQLDAMALVNVGYWHYFPAVQSGVPARVHGMAKVNFKMVDAPK